MQAIRADQWKAIRFTLEQGVSKIELYNLDEDLNGSHDLAGEYPQKADSLANLMDQAHRTPDHREFRLSWTDK